MAEAGTMHPMPPVAPPPVMDGASEHPDLYVPEIVRLSFLPHFYQKFKEKVSIRDCRVAQDSGTW